MGDAWLSIAHHDGAREHVRLTLALTTIGRSEQNVIELLDPKLSRFHCEIERRRDGHTIRDCNSRNGTLVNGEQVAGQHLLSDGDRIKIGRTLFTFHSQRPEELRSDDVVELPTQRASHTDEHDTPPTSMQRPTELFQVDRRQTLAVASPNFEKGGDFLARVGLEVLDASSRGELLEVASVEARKFLQAGGVLLVLGRNPDAMTVSASLGVEGEDKQRCMDVARRVLTAGAPVAGDRRALGLPVRSKDGLEGALVLSDLPGALQQDAEPVVALQALADLVGRAVTSNLQLEEVRRGERAAGARRIASDLSRLLRPPKAQPIPGLEVGVAVIPGDEVGRDVWDRIHAPERAGRREVYFAIGDVPDPQAPPSARLRRRGERSFVSLLGQAELRGALRAMVSVLPRTSDLLLELDQAVRRQGVVDRLSLVLCRYDPQTGALRFSGAGHEPILIRRQDGTVDRVPSAASPVGWGERLEVSERDLPWQGGDQVLLATAAAHGVGGEPIDRLFARLGGVAHTTEQVAQRMADALASLATSEDEARRSGFSLLLLRRS